MGTPCEQNSVARKLRRCLARRASTAGSSVGPSTPQFHDRLSSVPSRPPSPLASLCLSLYDTRSVSVNPSWHVAKLTEATGRRPLVSYRSLEPDSREANSGRAADLPRQKSRTASRYLPFHSDHNGGKLPTWYPPSPTSHGSAMSLTWDTTGSCWTRSKNVDSRSTSWSSLASAAARSNRNPSTCASRIQYHSEFMISW